MKVLWEELSKCFGKEKHQWNWGASTGKTSLQQSLFEPIRIDTRHWKTNVCSWLEISPTRFVNSLCFFLLMSMPFSLSRIASFWLHISNPNFPYFDILQNRCCRWFLPCLFFFFCMWPNPTLSFQNQKYISYLKLGINLTFLSSMKKEARQH